MGCTSSKLRRITKPKPQKRSHGSMPVRRKTGRAKKFSKTPKNRSQRRESVSESNSKRRSLSLDSFDRSSLNDQSIKISKGKILSKPNLKFKKLTESEKKESQKMIKDSIEKYKKKIKNKNGILQDNSTQTDNNALRTFFIQELKRKRRELDELIRLTNQIDNNNDSALNLSRLSSLYNANAFKFSTGKRNSSTKLEQADKASIKSEFNLMIKERQGLMANRNSWRNKREGNKSALSEIGFGKNRHQNILGLSKKKKRDSRCQEKMSKLSKEKNKSVVFKVSRKVSHNSGVTNIAVQALIKQRSEKNVRGGMSMQENKSNNSKIFINTPKDTIFTANLPPPSQLNMKESLASKSKKREKLKSDNLVMIRNWSQKNSRKVEGISQKSFNGVFSPQESPALSLAKHHHSLREKEKQIALLKYKMTKIQSIEDGMSLKSEALQRMSNKKKLKRNLNMSVAEMRVTRTPIDRLNTSIARMDANSLSFLNKMRKRKGGNDILKKLDNGSVVMKVKSKKEDKKNLIKASKEVLEELSNEADDTEKSQNSLQLKNKSAKRLLSALELMNDDKLTQRKDLGNKNIFGNKKKLREGKARRKSKKKKTCKFGDLQQMSLDNGSLGSSSSSSSFNFNKSLMKRREFLTSKIFEDETHLEIKTQNQNLDLNRSDNGDIDSPMIPKSSREKEMYIKKLINSNHQIQRSMTPDIKVGKVVKKRFDYHPKTLRQKSNRKNFGQDFIVVAKKTKSKKSQQKRYENFVNIQDSKILSFRVKKKKKSGFVKFEKNDVKSKDSDIIVQKKEFEESMMASSYSSSLSPSKIIENEVERQAELIESKREIGRQASQNFTIPTFQPNSSTRRGAKFSNIDQTSIISDSDIQGKQTKKDKKYEFNRCITVNSNKPISPSHLKEVHKSKMSRLNQTVANDRVNNDSIAFSNHVLKSLNPGSRQFD
jgi:hypothetical protein